MNLKEFNVKYDSLLLKNVGIMCKIIHIIYIDNSTLIER